MKLLKFDEFETKNQKDMNEGIGKKLAIGALALSTLAAPSCVNNTNYSPTSDRIENVKKEVPNATISLPNNFQITEKISMFGTNFKIKSNDKVLGRVEEKIISMSPTFKLYNSNDEMVAKSDETIFSLVTEVKIYDTNEEYIGKFEQKVFENMFSFENTYAIYDKNDNRIGTSRKLDMFSTTVEIFDNDDNLLIEMKRPMINVFTDKWEVKVHGNIDNRLVVFIPCYKTYADNQRKSSDSDK